MQNDEDVQVMRSTLQEQLHQNELLSAELTRKRMDYQDRLCKLVWLVLHCECPGSAPEGNIGRKQKLVPTSGAREAVRYSSKLCDIATWAFCECFGCVWSPESLASEARRADGGPGCQERCQLPAGGPEGAGQAAAGRQRHVPRCLVPSGRTTESIRDSSTHHRIDFSSL